LFHENQLIKIISTDLFSSFSVKDVLLKKRVFKFTDANCLEKPIICLSTLLISNFWKSQRRSYKVDFKKK